MRQYTPEQLVALRLWAEANVKAEQAKLVIAAEQTARKAAFAALGLSSDEGQQSEEMPGGWTLKYKTPYKRDVDPAVLDSLRAPLKLHRVSVDSLIEWKPTLKTKEYKQLTKEAREIFDACLTTTTSMPALELVPPKVKP